MTISLFSPKRQNCGPSEAAGVTCFHGGTLKRRRDGDRIFYISYIATNLSDDDTPLSDFASPEPEDQSATVSEGNNSQNLDWTSTFIMGTL